MNWPIPRGALVVSAQARPDNPLHGPLFMAAMAQAAEQGGAQGIRANGPADVAAIRAVTKLPIIGIWKRIDEGFHVSITPDLASAQAIAEAGCDIVALDATRRPRKGEPIDELIGLIHSGTGKAVMADVATLDEGVAAARAGADAVATTLAGYTEETAARVGEGPDLALVAALVAAVKIPVIAEGRFWTRDEIEAALRLGASAVVVGTAITNPREITRRLAPRL